MTFEQQFEINELYICAKFRGNESRDFSFRTRKPRQKFGIKSGLIEKRLKYSKKIFHRVIIRLNIPFYPYQPST